MRLFVQTASLMLLVVLGWNQPMRDLAAKLLPWADIAPSRLMTLRARAEGIRTQYSTYGRAPFVAPIREMQSSSLLNSSREQASP